MVTYPNEWKTYLFKKFFRLIPNNTLSRDKLDSSGSIGNIHYGDVLIKYGDTISDHDSIPRVREDIGFIANNLLQKNDVIIADHSWHAKPMPRPVKLELNGALLKLANYMKME